MNATKSTYQSPAANSTDNNHAKAIELDYIRIETDFFRTAGEQLTYHFGYGATGFYLDVKSEIGVSKTSEIHIDLLRAKAGRYGVSREEASRFLLYCTKQGLLARGSSDEYITIPHVIADKESVANKRRKWKDKKDSQRSSPDCPPVVPVVSPDIPPDVPLDRGGNALNTLNRSEGSSEDLNLKGMQGETLNFPEDTLVTVQSAMRRWQEFLKAKHRKDLHQYQAETILMKYATREDELIRDINFSISNGYRAIYPDKNARDGPEKPKESNVEQWARIAKEMENET